MADGDRERWDDRYRASPEPGDPHPFLVALDDVLASAGRAMDVAGGTGGTALWLAARGLDVTLVDVSEVAVGVASAASRGRGVGLTTMACDLEVDELPPGPFELITCTNYLQRDLFGPLAERLAPGGLLCVLVATVTNLERNEHPRREFLVERGELAELVAPLEIVSAVEDWFSDRHEARVVARRR